MELAQDDSNAFVLETSMVPTLSGYRFAGWNTKADGSGTAYVEGETYVTEDTVDSVTLYAQWSADAIAASLLK